MNENQIEKARGKQRKRKKLSLIISGEIIILDDACSELGVM